MNRKLHNTVSALSVSGVLLALALIAAVPIPPASVPDMVRAAPAAPLDTGLGQAEAGARPAPAGRDVSPGRRSRHGLAMPYFSFAPRG